MNGSPKFPLATPNFRNLETLFQHVLDTKKSIHFIQTFKLQNRQKKKKEHVLLGVEVGLIWFWSISVWTNDRKPSGTLQLLAQPPQKQKKQKWIIVSSSYFWLLLP